MIFWTHFLTVSLYTRTFVLARQEREVFSTSTVECTCAYRFKLRSCIKGFSGSVLILLSGTISKPEPYSTA
jgi:hypothetical protein